VSEVHHQVDHADSVAYRNIMQSHVPRFQSLYLFRHQAHYLHPIIEAHSNEVCTGSYRVIHDFDVNKTIH
jgi:hypothetical protein